MARAAGVSATYVSRIKTGDVPMPLTGRLAKYLGIKTTTVTTVTTVTTKRRKGAEGEDSSEVLSTATDTKSSTSAATAPVSDPAKLAWAVVDDTAVRLLPGGWEGARADIVLARAQPSLLFYEAMVQE